MSASDWPVTVDPTWGCWEWDGHLDKRDGRALTWRGGKPYAAYRAVYEAEVGEIPDGLVLSHVCLNPRCVWPMHLEPVTKSTNEMMKSWRYRVRRTHCKAGHALAEHGMVNPHGGRVCRGCVREAAVGGGVP